MKKSKLFSVIIPIYNVQDYLLECIESLSSQTADDIEFLLIDDGSTDNSGDIAKVFCEKRTDFLYFRKKNGGLSDARNYGLSHAQGEYIVFIDSDDIVSSDFFSKIKKVIATERSDLIYINYIKFFDEKEKQALSDLKEKLVYKNIGKSKLAKKPNFAWARVARVELYENNLFPVGVIYEDVVTSCILTSSSQKITHIVNTLYGYRKRNGSITTISAEKQFLLFESLSVLKTKRDLNIVSNKLFCSSYVNLIQSCLVSLVRVDSKDVYREKQTMIVNAYMQDLTILDIVTSYSKLRFKLLSICARRKILMSFVLLFIRPLVKFSDRKNRLIS